VELRREQDFQAPGRGVGEGGLSPGTRKDFFALVREQGVQQAGLRQTQNARADDSAFDQMVRQFNLVLRRGGGEARMQLHPENLGSMKLSVRLQRNELSTSIVVENQAIKELIMSRLPGLQETLAQQGFQIGSFQVEVQDRGSTREEGERAPQQVKAVLKEAIALAEDTMMVEAGVPWMSTHINVTV
jgi:flagellar hook-length control protein FliK